MQLPFDLHKAIDGLSRVTLKGGVVGKVTLTVISVSLALAAISWSVSNVWISAMALLSVFVLAFAMLWRLITFADKHPHAALLEGAELLVYEQIVHATKNLPKLPPSEIAPVQPEGLEGSAASLELARVPDRITISSVTKRDQT
jgi:hypothetical protein